MDDRCMHIIILKQYTMCGSHCPWNGDKSEFPIVFIQLYRVLDGMGLQVIKFMGKIKSTAHGPKEK